MTLTNKKMELPVKKIISGDFNVSKSTIANPGSLKFYERFFQVEEWEASNEHLGRLPANL